MTLFILDLVIRDTDWLGGIWEQPPSIEINLPLIWREGAEIFTGFVKYFIMTYVHEALHSYIYVESDSMNKHHKCIKAFEEELWDILFAGGNIA